MKWPQAKVNCNRCFLLCVQLDFFEMCGVYTQLQQIDRHIDISIYLYSRNEMR